MPDRRRRLALLAAALAAWLPCVAVRAADVELRVSAREVYVGVPFKIILTITNAREYEPPRLLDIPGLRQPRPPRSASHTVTFNGRTTSTVTLSYEVIAEADVLYMEPVVQPDYTASRQEKQEEYSLTPANYQITREVMKKAPSSSIVLHSLPRMDELLPEVDNTRHARYWQEAYNGVVMRMALLALVLGAVE